MAIEYDIYLRQQPTECDFVIRTLIYRDGISATNRIVLDCCLNGCLFYKFAAVQMQSELMTKIDQTIKRCLEQADSSMTIGASSMFEKRGMLYPDRVPIVLNTPALPISGAVLNQADANLVLAVQPLMTQTAMSSGSVCLSSVLDSSVADTLKWNLLSPEANTIPEAVVVEVNQYDFIDVGSRAVVNADLASLCYQLTFDAYASVELAALVLGTKMRHSLGVWYNGVAIGANVNGTHIQKFESAQSIVELSPKLIESIIQYIDPEDIGVVLAVSHLEAKIKRYRLLSELDGSTLNDLDDRPLEEIDFVDLP